MSTENFTSLHEILFIFRVFKPDVSIFFIETILMLPWQLTKGLILNLFAMSFSV